MHLAIPGVFAVYAPASIDEFDTTWSWESAGPGHPLVVIRRLHRTLEFDSDANSSVAVLQASS